MFSLAGLVMIVVYMLVAAAVVGVLWWVIGYVEAQGFGPPLVFKVIRIVFVLAVAIALCFFLISLISGQPLFKQDLIIR